MKFYQSKQWLFGMFIATIGAICAGYWMCFWKAAIVVVFIAFGYIISAFAWPKITSINKKKSPNLIKKLGYPQKRPEYPQEADMRDYISTGDKRKNG